MSILIENSIYIYIYIYIYIFEVYKINLKIIETVKCKLFYSYFNLKTKKKKEKKQNVSENILSNISIKYKWK